jgi:hypothetical protein
LLKPFLRTLAWKEWRELCFRNFRQSLKQNDNLSCFGAFLSSQRKLEFLELDLQMSHFLDGLDATEWKMLLTDTKLKRIRYRCSIDCYFQDDFSSMPLAKSITWTDAFRTDSYANEEQKKFLAILDEIVQVFDSLKLDWTICFDM